MPRLGYFCRGAAIRRGEMSSCLRVTRAVRLAHRFKLPVGRICRLIQRMLALRDSEGWPQDSEEEKLNAALELDFFHAALSFL